MILNWDYKCCIEKCFKNEVEKEFFIYIVLLLNVNNI